MIFLVVFFGDTASVRLSLFVSVLNSCLVKLVLNQQSVLAITADCISVCWKLFTPFWKGLISSLILHICIKFIFLNSHFTLHLILPKDSKHNNTITYDKIVHKQFFPYYHIFLKYLRKLC